MYTHQALWIIECSPEMKRFEVKLILYNPCRLHSSSEDVMNCGYILSVSYSVQAVEVTVNCVNVQ